MKKICILAAVLFAAGFVNAEVLSIGSGYNLDSDSAFSIDVGLSTGDVDVYGGRANFSLGENLIVFADVGVVDLDLGYGDDEMAYGAGVILKMDLDLPFMFGIKGSYHMYDNDFDVFGVNASLEVTEIAFRGIASGELADVDGLFWYAEVGVHLLDAEASSGGFGATSDDTELGFEGGIIYNLNDTVSLKGGFELVDENWINLGASFSF